MTREQRGELLMDGRYELGPQRVLQNIFAVDENIELLLTYASARGQCCKHWVFTFKDVDDLEQCIKDWGTFLRRVRAKTGVCGLRVFEWGRKTGRFHVHVVFDRWIDLGLVNRLKADLRTMGHAEISKKETDGNLARYFWKELTKQFRYRRALGRRRLWATFGRLAGFSGAKDIVIERTDYLDGVVYEGGFWKECKRLAWEVRITGESRRQTWERAWSLYTYKLWGKAIPWKPGGDSSPAVQDGDACEEPGGDVSFDPKQLES